MIPTTAPRRDETGKLVLTTGMHRSGTSLCANILHLVGVDMTTDPILGFEENERGFWERYDLTCLHLRVFHHLRRPWESALHPLPAAPGWWRQPALASLRGEMLGMVRDLRDASAKPLGVKDPRLCLLMPLWRDIAAELGLGLKVLVSLRHPLAVAASLKRRNGFDSGRALYMWLAYYLSLLNATAPDERYFVEYERWFSEPLDQARGVRAFLGLDWPGTEGEFEQVVTAAVDVGLRRHESGSDDGLWPPVRDLYRALRQAARSGESGELCDLAAGLWERYAAIAPVVPSLEEEGAARDKALHETKTALEKAEAGLSGLEAEKAALAEAHAARIAELETALAGSGAEAAALAARLADVEAALSRSEEDRTALAARLADLDAALVRVEGEKSGFAAEVAVGAARIVELEAAVAASEADRGGLAGRLSELEATLSRSEEDKTVLAARLADFDAVLVRIEGEKSGLAADVATGASRIGELEAALAGVEAERSEQAARLSDLHAALEQAATEKAALERECAERTEALDGVEAERSDQAARLSDLQAALELAATEKAALERECAERAEALDAAELAAKDLAARLGLAETALTMERNRAATLVEAANRAASRSAMAKNELARQNLRLAEAQNEVEALRRDLDAALVERETDRQARRRTVEAAVLSRVLRFEGPGLALGWLTETDPEASVGYVDEVDFEDGLYVVRGWAWDPRAGEPVVAVLVFDDQGFVDWSAPTAARQDVGEALGLDADVPTGFELRLWRPVTGTLVCYALTLDGALLELPHAA